MNDSRTEIVQHPCGLRDVSVTLVTSLDSAMKCARWLSAKRRIAVDTETTGLSPENDDVRLVQLGDDETAYVIPLEGTGGTRGHLPTARGWGGLAVELLRDFTADGGVVDMHNASYDHSMLRRTLALELPRAQIHDTRLMAHVHDAHGPIALKTLAQQLVDPRASLGQEILGDSMRLYGWNWSTIPISFEPYWWYAGLDVILTSRVRAVLEPQVQSVSPDAYALEMAVSWPCEDMERRGVLLDSEYTTTFAATLTERLEEVQRWAHDTYDGLSLGSSRRVIDILLSDGVQLVKRTPSGDAYSTDREALTGVDHPVARAALERRRLQKLLGYLNAYLRFHAASPDGRIHPDINTIGGTSKSLFDSGGKSGVRTNRMSSSNPNLQNVPTRTADGSRIRRCFIPREGCTWVKCDADQIESRILAHLSGDQAMRKAFHDADTDDGDFFVNMARQLFHDPEFQRSDPRRQLVKNGVYSKVYGAGIPKFAKTTNTSMEDAASFMADFDRMFGGVSRWIQQVIGKARQRELSEGSAYVRSPLTRRVLRADDNRAYTVVNYLVQGLAAELLKLKIVQADQAGLGQYMLFPVHDEIDFEVPTEDLSSFLDTLRAVMNDDKIISVPLTWSAEHGPSWGECG